MLLGAKATLIWREIFPRLELSATRKGVILNQERVSLWDNQSTHGMEVVILSESLLQVDGLSAPLRKGTICNCVQQSLEWSILSQARTLPPLCQTAARLLDLAPEAGGQSFAVHLQLGGSRFYLMLAWRHVHVRRKETRVRMSNTSQRLLPQKLFGRFWCNVLLHIIVVNDLHMGNLTQFA